MSIEPYRDDSDLLDDSLLLLRRLNRDWVRRAAPDESFEATSQGFQLYDLARAKAADCPGPGMSFVSIAHQGIPAEAIIDRLLAKDLAVAALTVAELRHPDFAFNLRPTDDDPGHVVVYPLTEGRGLPRPLRKNWAAAASQPGRLWVPPHW